jgi:hypothetical protein
MKDIGNTEVQWIIKFQDNKPQRIEQFPTKSAASTSSSPHVKKTPPPPPAAPPKRKPPIEVIVPDQPEPQKNPWLRGDLEAQRQAMESLEEIVEACKDLKGECIEKLDNKTEASDEKVYDVTENLKSLFKLILEFTKIMKKLKEGGNERPSKDQ